MRHAEGALRLGVRVCANLQREQGQEEAGEQLRQETKLRLKIITNVVANGDATIILRTLGQVRNTSYVFHGRTSSKGVGPMGQGRRG